MVCPLCRTRCLQLFSSPRKQTLCLILFWVRQPQGGDEKQSRPGLSLATQHTGMHIPPSLLRFLQQLREGSETSASWTSLTIVRVLQVPDEFWCMSVLYVHINRAATTGGKQHPAFTLNVSHLPSRGHRGNIKEQRHFLLSFTLPKNANYFINHLVQ